MRLLGAEGRFMLPWTATLCETQNRHAIALKTVPQLLAEIKHNSSLFCGEFTLIQMVLFLPPLKALLWGQRRNKAGRWLVRRRIQSLCFIQGPFFFIASTVVNVSGFDKMSSLHKSVIMHVVNTALSLCLSVKYVDQ